MKIEYGSKWRDKPCEIQQHNYIIPFFDKAIYFYPVYPTDICQYNKLFCVAIWRVRYKKNNLSWIGKVKKFFKSIF